jgi:hypothetical protein
MSTKIPFLYWGTVCKIEDKGFFLGDEDENLLFFMIPHSLRLGDVISIDQGKITVYRNCIDELKFRQKNFQSIETSDFSLNQHINNPRQLNFEFDPKNNSYNFQQ